MATVEKADTPAPSDTPAAECPICFCALNTAPREGGDPLDYFDYGIPEQALVCPSSLAYEHPHFVCVNCVTRLKRVDYSEKMTRLRWSCPICRASVPMRPFELLVLRVGNWGAAVRGACAAISDVGFEFEGIACKLVTTSEEIAQQVAAASNKTLVWSRPSPLRPRQSPPVSRPVLPRPRPRPPTNPMQYPPRPLQPRPTTQQRPSSPVAFDLRWRWEEVTYLSEDEQRLLASTWQSGRQLYNQLENFAARRRAQQQRMRRVHEQLLQTMSA